MNRQQLTVGVLGHVDHGKTALVKALTGVETDRLAEEKRRGLSIVLGFAHLESEKGIVDFIDVPGHESFIRTMISGATGIDAVLLVVAADEGIKPQTREHLAIAQLLGIKQGFIVINKSDLADQDLLAMAQQEIKEYVQGTFLASAPVYNVSAISGAGIEELAQGLINSIGNKAPRANSDNYYLPLDRVFTIDGFGTIGTGTLRNGAIRCEDEVEIMPSALKANIRELQVHNKKVTEALPGQRVAVNLRGVKRDQLTRGQILIKPGSIQATTCLHARLQVLANLSRLPKRNELIRLLFGTKEVLVKLRIVEENPLESGVELLVRFRCNEPVIASTGEKFIVRTCSPVITIGGGEFLDTSEILLQMPKDALINHLRRLEQSDTEGRILAHVQAAGTGGISLLGLAERAIASRLEINAVLARTNTLIINDAIVVDRPVFDDLCKKMIQALEKFHTENPSQPGLGLETFRTQYLKSCPAGIVEYLIRYLSDAKIIDVLGNNVRLCEFDQEANISTSDRELINSIEQVFKEQGTSTPTLDEITGKDPAKKRAYQYLKESGRLIPLKDTSGKKLLVFHLDTIEGIKKQLSDTYPPPQQFTVSDFRTLTDSSRKYVIPILEHFDRCHFTIRRGDYRTLSTSRSIVNNQ